jgi:UDP-N-acetylmuramyl pentapeptide phosphotransferase/UDP-N-acetylglucosamine-1-phosphate transferase
MIDAATNIGLAAAAAAFTIAIVISVAIIVAIRPWLQRIALAKPNARSSHSVPTAQGGGIAVVAATIIAAAGALSLSASAASATALLLPLVVAVIVIAAVGAADDMRPIGVAPRFFLQAFSVALVIFALPDELRVAPFMPIFIERLLLTIGGLWFVNLVNFMDGLDWMTVTEVVPVTAALAIFGAFGFLPATQAIISLALCGAMIGFAYFNRPVARLFLGDVGSLPVGLLLGWLLVQLAGRGAVAAAILLPLYYLADATITLIRRLIAGEKVWQAHRSHFYQRATDRGFAVSQVVARVFAVNIALTALALFTLAAPGLLNDTAALVCGAALVGWLLLAFSRGRGPRHSGAEPSEQPGTHNR